MINIPAIFPIINSFDSGIIIIDKKAEIIFWNNWLERHTQIQSRTVIGKLLNEQFKEIDSVIFHRKLNTAFTSNTPTYYHALSCNYFIKIALKDSADKHFEYMQQNVSIVPFDSEYAMIFINDQTQILEDNKHLEDMMHSMRHLNINLKKDKKIIDTYIPMVKIKDNSIIDISQAICKFSFNAKKLYSFKDVFHLDTQSIFHSNIDIYKLNNLFSPEDIWYRIVSKETNNNDELIYILEDITSQILLQDKQSQLMQQSQHAAMGEMLSMIAHQWRQPLAVISSLVGQIHMEDALGTFDKSKMMEKITKVDKTVEFLSKTITDFSHFFKPNNEKNEVDIIDLINQSLFFTSPALEGSDIELKNSSTTHHKIEVFESELIQVLINLIKNAIDEHKKNQVKNAYIEISNEIIEETLQITITDNAGGMSQEVIDKVFQPYFSTKAHNGTGLGLYMSRTIIHEHHNGTLTAQSMDKCASFIISLPLNTSS